MKIETIDIDEVDLRLLAVLQNQAGLSNVSLAQQLGVSAPTCLRRTKRLEALGVIEQRLAVLNPERLGAALGAGVTALIEVTLERQDENTLSAFERSAVAEAAVAQCYRVSPGPDFVLVSHSPDMPAHLALAQRLFTAELAVRNVKTYFSLKRSKFGAQLPLPAKLADRGA